MEDINRNEVDVKPIGSAIGISYILFGISFIFSLNGGIRGCGHNRSYNIFNSKKVHKI